MQKLKKGDTMMMHHESPERGMLLECTVIKIKGQRITLQIQLPFSDTPLTFKVLERDLQLFES